MRGFPSSLGQCVIGFIIALAACSRPGHKPEEKIWVKIEQVTDSERHIFREKGYIQDHQKNPTQWIGYIPGDQFDLLMNDATYAPRITKLNAMNLIIGTDEDTEGREYTLADQMELMNGYTNYQELTAMMIDWSKNNPDLLSLHSAGKSEQGRELWYVRISDNIAVDEYEPKLLYIANMHGDETTGRQMMIRLIDYLLNSFRAGDQRIKNLVNSSEIFIMPSMNPDGFELKTRWNAKGEDLNRNFPDFTRGDDDFVTQSMPAEVKAIMKLHDEHHFAASLNYHGGEVCFNIPWDTKRNLYPDERFEDVEWMSYHAHEYTKKNPMMYNNHHSNFNHGVTYGYEWFEIDGGMQDWSNYWRQSLHATIELSVVKWPPARELDMFWDANREGMIGFLEAGARTARLKFDESKFSNEWTLQDHERSFDLNFKRHRYFHRPSLKKEIDIVATDAEGSKIFKTAPVVYGEPEQWVVFD